MLSNQSCNCTATDWESVAVMRPPHPEWRPEASGTPRKPKARTLDHTGRLQAEGEMKAIRLASIWAAPDVASFAPRHLSEAKPPPFHQAWRLLRATPVLR